MALLSRFLGWAKGDDHERAVLEQMARLLGRELRCAGGSCLLKRFVRSWQGTMLVVSPAASPPRRLACGSERLVYKEIPRIALAHCALSGRK
jgi:hypothetical protein